MAAAEERPAPETGKGPRLSGLEATRGHDPERTTRRPSRQGGAGREARVVPQRVFGSLTDSGSSPKNGARPAPALPHTSAHLYRGGSDRSSSLVTDGRVADGVGQATDVAGLATGLPLRVPQLVSSL